MLGVLRTCRRLVGRDAKGRWLLVVLLALLMSGVEAVGALLVYLLLGMVTDPTILDGSFLGDLRAAMPSWPADRLFLVMAGVISVFFVVRGGLLVLQGYVESRVIESTGTRLATRLVRGYFALPYPVHVRRNSSQSLRNAFETVQVMVMEALAPSVKLVSEGLLTLGIFVVLVTTAPLATVLALVVIGPPLYALLRAVHPRLKALGELAQQSQQASLQTLQQSLQGMRDITLLGRERYFVRQFVRNRQQLARSRYLRAAFREMPRAAVETTLVLAIAAFFAVGVLIEGSAASALPVLGLFAYAAMRLKPSLNAMLASVNSLRFASAAMRDLEEEFALASAAPPAAPADVQALGLCHEITLEAVTFRYEGTSEDVLHAISLTIPQGASVGFVGPTGGGKSTLVDVIVGLIDPTSGSVCVDGHDVRAHKRGWQRTLGVVPQSVFLTDDTLRRNIGLGLEDDEIDEDALREAVRMAQLEEFVAALPAGLETVVGERGVRLSGGQRQRVAIARALYRRPSVLVFDEGTSALDNRTEAEFLRVLAELRGGRTLITVAHRLSTVRQCDRIYVVERGRITDAGRFDELAARNPQFQLLAQA